MTASVPFVLGGLSLVNAGELAHSVPQAQLAFSGQCGADLRSHAIDRAHRYSVTQWVGGG